MDMIRGFTGKTINHRGVKIEQFVEGYAYPRNGNTHNPTAQVAWVVAGEFFTLLRKAKAAIDEAKEER